MWKHWGFCKSFVAAGLTDYLIICYPVSAFVGPLCIRNKIFWLLEGGFSLWSSYRGWFLGNLNINVSKIEWEADSQIPFWFLVPLWFLVVAVLQRRGRSCDGNLNTSFRKMSFLACEWEKSLHSGRLICWGWLRFIRTAWAAFSCARDR